MNAFDKYSRDLELALEDPDYPLPLTCDNDSCDGEQLIFKGSYYECPLCGRIVNVDDIEEYLYSA